MDRNENTKNNSKRKTPDVKNMSKEDIQAALLKKKECDLKALKIVERLIENPVPPHWFVYSLRYINQNHLDDISEERSIVKQCGYPICLGVIKSFPKKQYAISTKTNKVYDITERKKFCSDQCYKAFIFIKEQMLTSPLWLREKEEIPDFKLLPWTTKGVPGLEVDFGLPKVEIQPSFASAADFVKDSLDDTPESFEEMERESYLEFEKEMKPSTSFRLSKSVPKSSNTKPKQSSNESITRKIIETQFSEIMAEDEKFKFSKHELKLINLSDKNRKTESEKISVESLKQRLENRRKAMIKQKQEQLDQSKAEDVASITENIQALRLNNANENEKLVTNTQVSTENVEQEKILQKNSKETDLQIKIQNYLTEMNESNIPKHAPTIPSNEVIEKKEFPFEDTKLDNVTSKEKHNSNEQNEPSIETEKDLTNNTRVNEIAQKREEENNSKEHISLKRNERQITQNKKNLSTTELAIQYVENCLTEWFTIDSLIFLRGQEKVRDEISKHSQIMQERLNKALNDSNLLDRSEAYLQLCKKIDRLEFDDNRSDEKIVNKSLKPLPDYRMLRAENKRLIVKVRSFFRGTMEIEEPDYSESETEEENSDDETDQTVLPTIDKKSQNVLRRRIVYNYLNKTVPGILQSFGLTSHDMNSEIRELISTFTLTAKNITFKPIHLNLLSIVILKMLAEKNRGLYKLMEEPTAIKYTNLLLGIYKLPGDYLINLTNKIMNIENIVYVQSNFESK